MKRIELESVGNAGTLTRIGEFTGTRQVVLRGRILDVTQQLRTLAHQVRPATEQVPRGPHVRRVGVGHRNTASS